jgi:hypothetical protein
MESNTITEEQKTAALAATAEILRRIDIPALDELRKRLELPPEAIGVVVQVYLSQFIVPDIAVPMIPRRILPMSASEPSRACERVTVKGSPKSPVLIEWLVINGGDAHDWIVNDFRIDGVTQFEQEGCIPGDMFASKAISGFLSPTSRRICKTLLELDVTYVGPKEQATFRAAVVGTYAGDKGSDVVADVHINMTGGSRPIPV